MELLLTDHFIIFVSIKANIPDSYLNGPESCKEFLEYKSSNKGWKVPHEVEIITGETLSSSTKNKTFQSLRKNDKYKVAGVNSFYRLRFEHDPKSTGFEHKVFVVEFTCDCKDIGKCRHSTEIRVETLNVLP